MKTIIDGSRCWMGNILKWVSREHQRFVVLEVWSLNSDLVAVMHNRHIGSLYRQKRLQHHHCPIVRLSVNGVSTIFSFASWLIYVLIGCRYPFMSYWQPSGAKTTVTCSLPHPENEGQQSVNSFMSCISRNQGITRIIAYIIEFSTPLTGKNTIYQS